MKNRLFALFLALILTLAPMPQAQANVAYLARGLTRTVGSVFAIPTTIIQHSSRIIFPVSILTGTVAGTVKTLEGLLMGGVDIARGAAPLAKYAVLFI